MGHFLHYWTFDRAARAFDCSSDGIRRLENGWFKRLTTGDVLWLVTRTNGEFRLVLRAEIARPAEERNTHPSYAIRNSKSFRNYRVTFTEPVPPYAIATPLRTLEKLRFLGAPASMRRLKMEKILSGPLGSLRCIAEGSVAVLEDLWETRRGKDWLSVAIRRAGMPVFATAEHRLKVEKLAVNHVTRILRTKDWKVSSRERDGVGYDLHCTRGRSEWHVEVKGTSGKEPNFFMTRQERKIAADDSSFRLAMVTSVLDRPVLRLHTGRDLLDSFEFSPLVYAVRRKQVPPTDR